jgi:hypothetical protein
VTGRHHRWRSQEATRIIGEYHAAGNHFDGLYQSLLPRLREFRRTDPAPQRTDGLLVAVQRVTNNRFPAPVVPWPHLALDTGVLLSYARLDNQTVGAAIVDAVTDVSCRLLVSPLAYLQTANLVHGTRGYGRLLRLVREQESPDVEPLATVAELDRDTATAIAGLDTEGDPAVVHTALLALRHRCAVGTLDPAPYHRLGYLHTVNLT